MRRNQDERQRKNMKINRKISKKAKMSWPRKKCSEIHAFEKKHDLYNEQMTFEKLTDNQERKNKRMLLKNITLRNSIMALDRILPYIQRE